MHSEQSVAECNLRRHRRHIRGAHRFWNFGLRIRRTHRGWQPRHRRASHAGIFPGCSRVRCNCCSWQIPWFLRRRWSLLIGSLRILTDNTCAGRARHDPCPVNGIMTRLVAACPNSGLNLCRVLLPRGGQAEQHTETIDCQGKPSHDLCRVLLTLIDFTPPIFRTVDETILAGVIFALLRVLLRGSK